MVPGNLVLAKIIYHYYLIPNNLKYISDYHVNNFQVLFIYNCKSNPDYDLNEICDFKNRNTVIWIVLSLREEFLV